MQQPITGYRTLTDGEVALINEIKAHAELTRELVGKVQHLCAVRNEGEPPASQVTSPTRWASIAQTHLQEGYMALVRSVAAPTTF
jgi:hypothetical protein